MDAIFGDHYTPEAESTGREALLPRSGHRTPIQDHHLDPPAMDRGRNRATSGGGGGGGRNFITRMFSKKSDDTGSGYSRLEAGNDE